MNVELLEKSILEKLPQVTFIVDQVGMAMKLAKEKSPEGDYAKNLKGTLNVVNYAAEVSESNFFKYHLVIASLLGDIPDILSDTSFEPFKTASGATEDAIKNTIVPKETIENLGCFKATSVHLVPLSHNHQDYFACMLCHILADLEDLTEGMKEANVKAPITPSDYVVILGYSFVIQNVLASAQVVGPTASILNKIQILLNGLSY